MRISFLLALGAAFLFTTTASAQITVANSASLAIGSVPAGGNVNQDTYTLSGFNVGAGNKLIVAIGTEAGTPSSFGVTFGGTALTQIGFSTDGSNSERSALYLLDGATGTGNIDVTLSNSGEAQSNGPGIYAVSLVGALTGFETVGSFGNGQNVGGPLTGSLTGISAGAYTLAAFTDQGNPGDVIVTGDLGEVGTYNGPNGHEIGSGTFATASGFGNGSPLSVTFSDNSPNTNGPFQNRSNFVFGSFAAAPVPEPGSAFVIGLCGVACMIRRRK